MPHPKPADGNVALISPPEGAVAAVAPAPEADDRWVWFEDEHGERFRVPRSWVQGAPADASNAGGSAEEADPDEAGGIRIKNPTLSRIAMLEESIAFCGGKETDVRRTLEQTAKRLGFTYEALMKGAADGTAVGRVVAQVKREHPAFARRN